MAIILQLSDLHLFTNDGAQLLGMNTTQSFDAVLSQALKQHPQYSAMVLTGDLIQDDLSTTYQKVADLIERAPKPIYWIPGNHDIEALNHGILKGENILDNKAFSVDNWRIILLDSRLPDKVEGFLAEAQLQFLKSELEQHQDKHCLIFLHHNPVDTHTVWLDPFKVKNVDQLWEIVDAFSNIRAIIWGHVHQEFEGERNNIKLFSTPSTCIQFKPLSKGFTLDNIPPGYRWIELHSDGSLITKVERLSGIKLNVDLNATGY